MRRDYLASFIAEAVAVLSSLLLYRIAAAQWSLEGFAEYTLSRKVLSAILVVGLVGMDLALVRWIASEAPERRDAGGRYLTAALAIAMSASLAVAVILLALPAPLARILYGEPGHEDLLPPLALLTIGGSLQGLAYGYERGHLRIGRAALLLVLNAGVTPLAAVVLSPGSIAGALVLMGAGWTLVGGVLVALRARSFTRVAPVRPLLAYGSSRGLGLLLQMAFLAAPAVVAANRSGIVEGGSVAFALLAVGLLSTALTPIGVVLMPRGAQMIRERAVQRLRAHVRMLLAVVVPSVTVVVLLIEVLAGVLLPAYLGPSYAAGVPALRGIAWSAIPWSVFVTLRGLLDASDLRPLNARNLLTAAAVDGVLVGSAVITGAGEASYYAAFDVAVVVLAGLTLLDTRRVLASPTRWQAVGGDGGVQ